MKMQEDEVSLTTENDYRRALPGRQTEKSLHDNKIDMVTMSGRRHPLPSTVLIPWYRGLERSSAVSETPPTGART